MDTFEIFFEFFLLMMEDDYDEVFIQNIVGLEGYGTSQRFSRYWRNEVLKHCNYSKLLICFKIQNVPNFKIFKFQKVSWFKPFQISKCFIHQSVPNFNAFQTSTRFILRSVSFFIAFHTFWSSKRFRFKSFQVARCSEFQIVSSFNGFHISYRSNCQN